jgi:hypothetical protein
LPCAEVRKALEPYAEVFRLIDRAARCERCDWGITERLRKDGFNALLPELQPLRQFAGLLAVRIRLGVAEGRFDRAVRDLQTGFAVARQAGESPTLISHLVGVAIAAVMAKQLEAFAQQPGAPNLYWALADLPRPFLDIRKSLEGERVGLLGSFPGLEEIVLDPNAGALPPEKSKKLADTVIGDRGVFSQFVRLNGPMRWGLGTLIKAKHESAKRALVAAGRPRAKVEEMPPFVVALLHALLEYDRLHDEMIKWQTFPYWEAQKGLEEAERMTKLAKVKASQLVLNDSPAIPLAPLVLPAIQKVMMARTRLDRRLAALRCVEAVRLYGAAHGATLPATLSAIKQVPVPIDPGTGKEFTYQVTGEKASLAGPPLANEPPNPQINPSYELRMQR